mgnify:CR=1 FL=1
MPEESLVSTRRIREIIPQPDMMLTVTFDDGRCVLYDAKEGLNLPGYDALRTLPGLFQSVQLAPSRTCVFWNDEIDLPSDAIYEYGKIILPARLS